MEEIENALSALRAEAPPQVRGRRPTTDEIAAQRRHKQRIKHFLDGLPEEQRQLFTTSGDRAGGTKAAKAKQDKQYRKKKAKPAIAQNLAQTQKQNNERKPVDYICVLDFEATCNREGPAPRPQEIIEFPSLMVDVRTGNVISEFHHYIKPHVHPVLSDFCTELTGITQETVDSGISLFEALDLHQQWLESLGVVPSFQKKDDDDGNKNKKSTFLYVTCGDWDLKTCLPNQLDYHNHQQVPYSFRGWLNIKHEYRDLYGKKPFGMTSMLRELNLELQGRHHSGIDDCRNIAQICCRMLQDGWIPGGRGPRTPETKTAPTPSVEVPRPVVTVGVVGTSRHGLVDKNLARKIVFSTLDEIGWQLKDCGKEPVIVSGGGIVPMLAFQWAQQHGHKAKQVVSTRVKSKPTNRAVERIVVGTNHGDESDRFIQMIDAFVRIGGGPQSIRELEMFRRNNPDGLVVQKDLPLL